MLALILTIIISYFVSTLFGHVSHWALHQPWTKGFSQSHLAHHQKLYPPHDYVSKTYRSAGKDSSFTYFFLTSLPLVVAPLILCLLGFISWYLLMVVWLVQGLMGFLHDYMHDSFHIKNHWMNRVPWLGVIFRKWSYLHYLHHVNMEINYGIFSFHWDRAFRTFRTRK